MSKWIIKIVLFCCVVLPATGRADVGVDATLGGLFPYENYYQGYGYLYLMFGSIGVGGVYHYSQPHYYMTDQIYGVGFKHSKNFVFELSGGLFERSYTGVDQTGEEVTKKGHGFGGALIIGKNFSKHWRITFPAVLKRLTGEQEDELARRWTVEVGPTIGVRFF